MANTSVFSYDILRDAPLIVDALYKGGCNGNVGDDPIFRLMPKCKNLGGFRPVKRTDDPSKYAYVVIYSSKKELEWPDYLDRETGVYRYYGDNRQPGNELHDTPNGGNTFLKQIYSLLSLGNEALMDIPPLFIFEKAVEGRDVYFLGLAAPGSTAISPDRDLISFWRTINEKRFQNYEAYFTILDTKEEVISKEWIISLKSNHRDSINCAPKCWKNFVLYGREGIKPLKAPRAYKIRSKSEQIPDNEYDIEMVKSIKTAYISFPQSFEHLAVRLVEMMDSNFIRFDVTRPWRDGGRDAVGKYRIGTNESQIFVDCALEAKCYDIHNSVGVRELSRLISRIKYRQFGILITTSYIDSQAYHEIEEDGHPVLLICARDIIGILKKNSITTIESLENLIDEVGKSHP